MTLRRAWLLAALLLYLALTCHQLGLPGLHYDEAKEAGLNAMQMLTGAPLTPFRDAALTIGGLHLPLMVQDYIGALNVYLALPLLAVGGIGVPNLRFLPILSGLAALLLIERSLSEWWAYRRAADASEKGAAAPLSAAGLIAVTLLAVSPSYVFWARQGVFVTNLTLPFVFLCLWQGVRWLRSGQSRALILAALGGGLALYAKLSAYWVVVPFAALAGAWWLYARVRRRPNLPRLSGRTLTLALGALLLPLLPFMAFNLQTGGTLATIGGNLERSYYGVNNADVLANAALRWGQVVQVLRGDQFWYLGAVYANSAAPWLALLAIAAGLWRNWRVVAPPLLLLGAVFSASLFTVSDLFVTHYVLLQPLLICIVALALAALIGVDVLPTSNRFQPVSHGLAPDFNRGRAARARRAAGVALLITWLALDLTTSLAYHRALAQSGGLADHSDASYHLAYHLQYNGMGAPIALDWGIDAPVRYLTRGSVTPIEIFGYGAPDAPDDQFAARLAPFLANPDNRYLLHAPTATVFAGRREAFTAAVQSAGLYAEIEQIFTQRDGVPLYEIWRVIAP